MELAFINLKDEKGFIWFVPVNRVQKMKIRNSEVYVYLENEEMPYILLKDEVNGIKYMLCEAIRKVYVI